MISFGLESTTISIGCRRSVRSRGSPRRPSREFPGRGKPNRRRPTSLFPKRPNRPRKRARSINRRELRRLDRRYVSYTARKLEASRIRRKSRPRERSARLGRAHESFDRHILAFCFLDHLRRARSIPRDRRASKASRRARAAERSPNLQSEITRSTHYCRRGSVDRIREEPDERGANRRGRRRGRSRDTP